MSVARGRIVDLEEELEDLPIGRQSAVEDDFDGLGVSPVVAIGGIRLENAREVLEAGAQSIAVIRDLLSSTDIKGRALEWIRAVAE